MSKILVIFLLLYCSKAQALFSDCDDEDYSRPQLEEFFDPTKEAKKLEKILKDLCLKLSEEEILSKASFYASKFEGRKTASAEIYDANLLTAAHRNLKFGTYVLVTNPANEKSVIVKVNDRGPFVMSRDLDLSEAAAKRLEITQSGVASIKYIILEESN